jgi:uncharacterized protein (DUF362 family)
MHPQNEKSTPSKRWMSRRSFIQIAGTLAAGVLLSRCGIEAQDQDIIPTATEVIPTSVPPTATLHSPSPTPQPTDAPVTEATTVAPTQVTEPISSSSRVAIGKANAYDRNLIRNTVRDMLDSLGGLADVVRSGDRVAIKTNLTGGTGSARNSRFDPLDAYLTHPEVVRALAELTMDAGAREVFIVEAVYEWDSYVVWGFEDLAADLGVTLIDLNQTDPYDDYATVSVPGGDGMYSEYIFNHILHDVDVFMSVSKMKCHWNAGVTHTMKNLFGLVPARFYRLSPQHNHRSEFHGPSDETAGYRVPRIIVDLNKTRPVNFALIDGVVTIDGGEGPWLPTFGTSLLKPGVMFAGKNAVSTDAVATAAQGFDPAAPGMTVPFVRADNHLELARLAGLGTNQLEQIDVIGYTIDDVKMDFKPCVV